MPGLQTSPYVRLAAIGLLLLGMNAPGWATLQAPDSLNFGSVDVVNGSSTLVVTLSNEDPFTVFVDSAVIVGSDNASFSVLATPPMPFLIPANTSFLFQMGFDPMSLGTQSAVLVLGYQTLFNPNESFGDILEISLGGVGTESPVQSPIPEPQTYALLLAGLALLGFAIRRRLVLISY